MHVLLNQYYTENRSILGHWPAVRIQASTSKHFQEMADVKYWHDVKKKLLRHARESSNTHVHVKRHFLAPVEVPEITFVIGRVHRPTGIQGSPVRS